MLSNDKSILLQSKSSHKWQANRKKKHTKKLTSQTDQTLSDLDKNTSGLTALCARYSRSLGLQHNRKNNTKLLSFYILGKGKMKVTPSATGGKQHIYIYKSYDCIAPYSRS